MADDFLSILGKFGKLWTFIRNIECLTPEAYIEILFKVFGGKRSKKDRLRTLKSLPNAQLRSEGAATSAAADGSAAPAKFDVKEIYYTTDWKALFKDGNDTFMSSYTKDENTQLAWKMEAVPRSAHYPLGVRVMYKVLSFFSERIRRIF